VLKYTQRLKKGKTIMKGSELIKLLKKNGCSLVGHGGRHDEWFSPITGKTFPVPRHNKEIPKGTALSILKDAGLK
jgi:conserved domain protein